MALPPWFIRQLGHPRGAFGRLLARALNRGNLPLNLHMIAALDVQPYWRVLEVGFGGGVGLDLLLRHEPTARAAGVELATDMVALVRRRFAAEVAAGRLEVSEGSVERLGFADASFDAACTANCVYFWPDVPAGLRELARVLRPGAPLVVAIQDPKVLRGLGFDAQGLNTLDPEKLAAELRAAGFPDARARRVPDPERPSPSLVVGHRAG